MSTLKVNEVRHLSNSGTANIVLESNATTNLQATSTLGLTVTGTLTTSGVATFNGNVVIGNASTDTLTLTSKVSGSNNYSGFTGEIKMYAGNAAGDDPPDGWLYCNGNTIGQTSGNHSGTELQNLFNLLSASALWGNTGSEAWASATVKLPDFRSRSPVGIHTGAANSITAGLTARALSATAGTETHTLTTAQLAAHTHASTIVGSVTGQTVSYTRPTASQADHTHTLSHTHSLSSHTHNIDHTHSIPVYNEWNSGPSYGIAFDNGPYAGTVSTNSGGGNSGGPSNNTSGGASATTTSGASSGTVTLSGGSVTITNPTHTHTLTAASTGSGSAHNNLSPIIAVNYIIKV
jgi:microcystin-dependent protein